MTDPQPRRRRSASRARKSSARRLRGWAFRLLAIGTLLVLGLLGWAVLARHFAPTSNTFLTRFDAIIVLGTPADPDGNPTPEMLQRVTEGVREYERGVAPRLIVTGGLTSPTPFMQPRFIEANVMARTAQAQGVPASAIFPEPNAKDTIQNACFAVRIMKAHGWRSAEVISRASHLPRSGLIFSRLPIEWQVHALPQPQSETAVHAAAAEVLEVVKTARYLVWTRQNERCQP